MSESVSFSFFLAYVSTMQLLHASVTTPAPNKENLCLASVGTGR